MQIRELLLGVVVFAVVVEKVLLKSMHSIRGPSAIHQEWLNSLAAASEMEYNQLHQRRYRRRSQSGKQLLQLCSSQSQRHVSKKFARWIAENNADSSLITRASIRDEDDGTTLETRWKRSPAECDSGADSSASVDRALCPWQWRPNQDNDRLPNVISEAHCLCRTARTVGRAVCRPIRRQIPVLRRQLCRDKYSRRARYEYVKSYESISVGCHGVLPWRQRATPFHVHLTNGQNQISDWKRRK